MTAKAKVFIADDDELIVATLSRALKKAGYDIRGAGSARGLAEKIPSRSSSRNSTISCGVTSP